jgi:hypothetical protein
MKDPTTLLRAARLHEPWPFDAAAQISSVQKAQNGFLSIKLDMDGFVDAIRSVVREQFKPRTLKDLLADRPLRIGLSDTQPWMYETRTDGTLDTSRGLIPEFVELLQNALQCPVQSFVIPFTRHLEKLRSGEIDMFGPMVTVPHGPAKSPFSIPINRVGVSAIMRVRPTQGLESISEPGFFEELRDPAYQIAVTKDSRAHLLANTRLNRTNDSLILCDSVEEALDRVTTRGVSKPAHIFICNTTSAYVWAKERQESVKVIFGTRTNMIDIGDNAFAIRADWPEVIPVINDAISFILNSAGFAKRSHEVAKACAVGVFDPADYNTSHLQGMLGMVG